MADVEPTSEHGPPGEGSFVSSCGLVTLGSRGWRKGAFSRIEASRKEERRTSGGRAALQSLEGRNTCRKERRGAKFGGGSCVGIQEAAGGAGECQEPRKGCRGCENDGPDSGW